MWKLSSDNVFYIFRLITGISMRRIIGNNVAAPRRKRIILPGEKERERERERGRGRELFSAKLARMKLRGSDKCTCGSEQTTKHL
jgi:hypothetical protein